MKLVYWVVVLVVLVGAKAQSFNQWKAKFKKTYNSSTEAKAKAAYEKTVAAINAHNKNPNATYRQAVNEASGYTQEQKQKRNGYVPPKKTVKSSEFKHRVKAALPDALDYTSKMSPVKDQGLCGADYAFAAVATFEYLTIKNNGSLILLSEQQLIDCDPYNKGCTSGNPGYSMAYAVDSGVALASKYSYTSGTTGKNGTCQKTVKPSWFLSNFCLGNLGGLENYLKSILFVYGPMTVIMDGSDPDFANYKSGVFTSAKCSNVSKAANLAVVVVGYGSDPTTALDYWIVRSSFGPSFGMNGYFWIKRGVNMCGISNALYGPC